MSLNGSRLLPMALNSLRWVSSFWKRGRTQSGSSSPISLPMINASGRGHTASSHGCRLKEGNWEPSKYSATVRVKYSDLELDALQWSGQGVYSSIPVATTLPGSGGATRGRLTSKRARALRRMGPVTALVVISLGPLSGALGTLLVLAHLGQLKMDMPEFSLRPTDERRSINGN